MEGFPYGPTGFWIAFLAIGTAMLAWNGVALWWAISSEEWPKVVGHVSGSEAVHHADDSSINVTYRYEVNGRQYAGSRIRFGGSSRGRLAVQWTAADYRPGRTVQVAHDPSNPERSVLEPGVHRDLVLTSLAALGVAGVGVFNVVRQLAG